MRDNPGSEEAEAKVEVMEEGLNALTLLQTNLAKTHIGDPGTLLGTQEIKIKTRILQTHPTFKKEDSR